MILHEENKNSAEFIRKKLKAEQVRQGWSNRRMSLELGIDPSVYRVYMHGMRNFGLFQVIRVYSKFDWDMNELKNFSLVKPGKTRIPIHKAKREDATLSLCSDPRPNIVLSGKWIDVTCKHCISKRKRK